jgi:zinc transport system permease protein
LILDDFLLRAVLGGMGVAAVAGPLGCFIVWRRMAYFGDTVSHSGLLGVALGLVLGIDVSFGVLLIALAVAFCLILVQRLRVVPNDTLLGILSHASLSIGLVVVSVAVSIRVDLMAYLFGDILAVGTTDIFIIYTGGGVLLCLLAWIWRDLLAATVNAELVAAEGGHPAWSEAALVVMIAVVIAIAMKVVGILLITSLLIIPAATARRFARTPEHMAILAALIGMLTVPLGIAIAFAGDTPAGPTIVVASAALFATSIFLPSRTGF